MFYKTAYTKAKDHIELIDLSTPLTIENYLRATNGGAVGLDVTPDRFCNPVLREHLDPISKIPGLAMTGQDTTLCGVTLCQVNLRFVDNISSLLALFSFLELLQLFAWKALFPRSKF